jgi:hypothetical protein
LYRNRRAFFECLYKRFPVVGVELHLNSSEATLDCRFNSCRTVERARVFADLGDCPVLQGIRLRSFLKFKRYMSKRNRQRLKARIATAPIKELKSKRLRHHAIPLPQSNYGTRGAMHWR